MWQYTVLVIQKDQIKKGWLHAWLTALCSRNSPFIFQSVLLLLCLSPPIVLWLLSALCAIKRHIKPILKTSFWLRRATWPMNILTKPWSHTQRGTWGQEPETQWLMWPFHSGAAVAPLRLPSDNPESTDWTDIVPLKSSFKTRTIESLHFFCVCEYHLVTLQSVLFFSTLSRCDKSALGMAFLLCYPESIRVLFPIWQLNKAVHFVWLVSKSSFLCFILLKLLGGAANTVWNGHHSIHKGRFEVPPRTGFKDMYFFTVVIRHHKESNQIVGFLYLQQIGVCLLFCFQNKLIVFLTIRTEEMASRLKKRFVKSECYHHTASTGAFCFLLFFSCFTPSFYNCQVGSLFFEYQIACQTSDIIDLQFRPDQMQMGGAEIYTTQL